MRNIIAVTKYKATESDRATLIRNLCDLSVQGLVSMYDGDRNGFCYRVRKTEQGIVCDGESLRYTIITLLGLKRYEQHLGPSPISIREAFNETVNKSASIEYSGDAGLLLWLTAMAAPERLDEVYSKLDIAKTWGSYRDASEGMTTELSWLLTGLCYAMLVGGRHLPGLADTAAQVYYRVKANFGGKGIFRHQHGKSIIGALRGNIGCFADQVYPIYAFTRFAETHGSPEALEISRQCSDAICGLQGSHGQWWWYYDAKTGGIAGRYPVYSVHQEGMAPMALFAAAEKTGADYEVPIYKGLEWITGNNELGVDMRDFARRTIWRNFYEKRWNHNRKLELLAAILGNHTHEDDQVNLEILYECRPYCFGWLLYAFADKVDAQLTMDHVLDRGASRAHEIEAQY